MLMPSIFGEDLFDDFMGYPTGRQAAANAYPQVKDMMKTDIRDVDGNYELEIDLPGFKKDEIQIELKDGYLTVTATAKKAEENTSDKKEKYVQKERFHATCNRSFYVGDNMKQEDIKAKFENGVLTLQVPKKEEIPEEQTKKFITIG